MHINKFTFVREIKSVVVILVSSIIVTFFLFILTDSSEPSAISIIFALLLTFIGNFWWSSTAHGRHPKIVSSYEQEFMTKNEYEAQFGMKPKADDLYRVNCKEAGKVGHWFCGICKIHHQPHFHCGCYNKSQMIIKSK